MSELQLRVGRRGEEMVVKHLKTKGMTILHQNYRCRFGEADVVARDGDTIVFIEVKTRRSKTFGEPEESVDIRKQKKLIRTAEHYLTHHNIVNTPYRIDTAFIVIDPRGDTELEYTENALEDLGEEDA